MFGDTRTISRSDSRGSHGASEAIRVKCAQVEYIYGIRECGPCPLNSSFIFLRSLPYAPQNPSPISKPPGNSTMLEIVRCCSPCSRDCCFIVRINISGMHRCVGRDRTEGRRKSRVEE